MEESVIEPESSGGSQATWRFGSPSVLRVRSAYRLQRDLGINLPGIALALDLLDELETLRTKQTNESF